ncbi:MAG: DUF2357 domain-containing protein [Chloroflexi bacterium]|uniref:DUF2357 domain-containing protein n=1 Tax=Candidatus Chlorohelix allophototropha TaxID=3003348 RepID=A0A8T7M3T7_9CHLR|nr:DUF2357 domain-containing protein [Chloroflexota bacterium]WJW69989.1 restriction endonuclease-like protein [Chloroflexota bacterium L227-S17]
MAIPASGANSWLTINGKSVSFDPRSENEELTLVEELRHAIRSTTSAPAELEVAIVDGESPLDNPNYNLWYWKPDKFAGLYELKVTAPGVPEQIARVRIYPRKVSYDEYRKMLADIAAISYDLLFRVGSPSSEKAVAQKAEGQSSALRQYELLRKIVVEMEGVMAQIRRNPYKVLGRKDGEKLLQHVGSFSGEVQPRRGEYVKLPQQAAVKCRKEQLPRIWNVPNWELTCDVYENQLLKSFLSYHLVPLFNAIHESAEKELVRLTNEYNIFKRREWKTDELELQIRKLKEILPECEGFKQRCLSWSGEPFLHGVKHNTQAIKATQVLLKNFAYSRFFRLYLQLRAELKIRLDAQQFLTDLSLRKMADIYEMWAIFYITEALIDSLVNSGFQITRNNFFIELEDGRFQVDVTRNFSSIILVKEGLQVEMKYEPKYLRLHNTPGIGIDSGTFLTPDFALEVWRGNEAEAVILFDPKYRIVVQDGIKTYPYDAYGKMADYQQRIRYLPLGSKQVVDIVTSAYILYPGETFRHSSKKPGLGAIPLHPNMSQIDKGNFQTAIKDILTYAGLG